MFPFGGVRENHNSELNCSKRVQGFGRADSQLVLLKRTSLVAGALSGPGAWVGDDCWESASAGVGEVGGLLTRRRERDTATPCGVAPLFRRLRRAEEESAEEGVGRVFLDDSWAFEQHPEQVNGWLAGMEMGKEDSRTHDMSALPFLGCHHAVSDEISDNAMVSETFPNSKGGDPVKYLEPT